MPAPNPILVEGGEEGRRKGVREETTKDQSKNGRRWRSEKWSTIGNGRLSSLYGTRKRREERGYYEGDKRSKSADVREIVCEQRMQL